MPVDEPLGALGQIVVRVEGALEHLAGLQRYLELAFVDIQAIDVFHPNVAVALVVKVLPGFSGVLDRIANHLGDLAWLSRLFTTIGYLGCDMVRNSHTRTEQLSPGWRVPPIRRGLLSWNERLSI
jgi:hypothetical protein